MELQRERFPLKCSSWRKLFKSQPGDSETSGEESGLPSSSAEGAHGRHNANRAAVLTEQSHVIQLQEAPKDMVQMWVTARCSNLRDLETRAEADVGEMTGSLARP
ncbi:hypothetical protein GBF38_018501 [Nibea albiflora]|uniref:Uncharacterized protein n=1 Tax=Nibea albiflora TaxID=240163 RepID=A0ACB7EMN1_NIBAL|nr:hypothetical protein GBF38_018501 [Nibea albiflora]